MSLKALKTGLDFAATLKELFSSDPTTDILSKLDTLLTQSTQLLEGVEATRKAVVASFLSTVNAEIELSLDYWTTYASTGDPDDRRDAITNAKSASKKVSEFSTSSDVEKVALISTLIAATAVHVKMINEFENGATSGAAKGELQALAAALQAAVQPLHDQLEDSIILNIVDQVEVYGPGYGVATEPFSSHQDTTISFTSATDPTITSGQITFSRDITLGHWFKPDIGGIDSWANAGDTGDWVAFRAWIISKGYGSYIDPMVTPLFVRDYDQAGGNELEATVANLNVLTSGHYYEGDNQDNNLASDTDPGYVKPDTLNGKGGEDVLEGGAGNDSLIGGDDNDLLLGYGGNDFLNGGADDDSLHGGLGNDRIDGGTGVDTVKYGTSGAGVTVSLAIETAQNTIGNGTDTIKNVENLEGSYHDDDLTGDRNANVIRGRSGHDHIKGLGGSDTLIGQADDDILDGGTGVDTAIFDGATGAVVDLSTTAQQNTNHGHDTLISIENVTTGSGSDLITGNSDANHLIAGQGSDTLEGKLGNDILDGGDGVDTAYFTGSLGITVDLTITGAQTTGHGNDTLIGIENIFSGTANDILTGNAGANSLLASGGADTLNGGGGADYLSGGSGVDTALFLGGVNVTVDLSLTSAQATGHGNDRLSSIENVTSGSGADRLSGNDGANHLIGGNGADRLFGGLGDDILQGDGGQDFALFTGAVDTQVDLTKTTAQATGHGNDTLIGIENVTTQGGNDTLTGDNGANRLNAGDGADTLIGGGGRDILVGGKGNDTALFTGGSRTTVSLASRAVQNTGHGQDKLAGIENVTSGNGNDRLTGSNGKNILMSNGGNDRLDGGKRDDRLDAGKGDDVLTGGTGRDTFVFSRRDGENRVADFENNKDKFEIDSGISSFAKIKVTDQGSNVLLEFSKTSVLLIDVNHNKIDASDFLFT